MADAMEIANWYDNNPVVQAMKQVAYERGVAEGEKRGRTAEAAEPPEPCPLEHVCDDESPCGCWCDLHDVRMDECPTFRLVTGWLADAERRGRTAAAEAIEAHAESVGWYEHGGTWVRAIEIARGADQ